MKEPSKFSTKLQSRTLSHESLKAMPTKLRKMLYSTKMSGTDFKLNVDPDLGVVLDMDVHDGPLHDTNSNGNLEAVDLNAILEDVNDLRSKQKSSPKRRSSRSEKRSGLSSNDRRRPSVTKGNEKRRPSIGSAFIGSVASSVNDAFRRNASFTDVGSQIALNLKDLKITMDERNNLSTTFCPGMAPYFIWFYHSKWFIIALWIVTIVAFVSDLWIFMVILLLGMFSVMDWQYLKYVPRHSFHHFVQQISIIIGAGSRLVIEWDAMRHSNEFGFLLFKHLVRAPIGGMIAIWMIESIDGFRTAQWARCTCLMAGILTWIWTLVQMSYFIGEFEGVQDVKLAIPAIHSEISMRHMFLASGFNGLVLLCKKLHFEAFYKDHIMVVQYPVIEWLSDFSKNIQESIWRSTQRQRTTTLSLDIFKQVNTQKVELFLDDTNDTLHWLWRERHAEYLEDFYASKYYNIIISLTLSCYLISGYFQFWPLVLFTELIAIILLLLALFTSDIKMVKYYLRSFEFYFKLLNWIMYIVAALIWNVLNEDWDAMEWADVVLFNIARTLILLYILCIDAFHITHRTKVITMVVWICVVLYLWLCIAAQVHIQDPWQKWQDSEVKIPLLSIQISLRMMLLNSLGNFIVFVGNQLALIVLHPGKANIPMYPKVEWIGDQSWASPYSL